MADEWKAGIQSLLNQSRVCFLATQGEGGPETSMAPCAIHQGNILLHLSKLARHTANIETDPAIGLMICTPETVADSPLALPRVSLQGEASPVPDGQLEAAKAAYLSAIPDAEPLFSFADFRLFQFTPSHIHWVGGFGSARKIAVSDWRTLFAGNEGNLP
ncbi:MAG: pyridoxamine 5'-phosphate oxidase family protein [Mariprofundaceae bacterium]|nr:pyridoxamine 5'-phosphate oxidase family protein [Mariprofundaceae bacterium]